MNAHTEITADPLARLREPFAPNHISKLPKPTKAQTEAVKVDYKVGIRCKDCGSWHHPDVIHLDYVGHAALTDRLLDTDPHWSWEPVAFRDGLPAFDQSGGLWIRLTVCGVTRLGYGHAAAKQGVDPGAREKEVIGDALRNAAMRFGAALDLWHKGDLHADEDGVAEDKPPARQQRQPNKPDPKVDEIEPAGGWGDWTRNLIKEVNEAESDAALDLLRDDPANKARINATKKVDKAMYDAIGAAFTSRRAVVSDEVPF